MLFEVLGVRVQVDPQVTGVACFTLAWLWWPLLHTCSRGTWASHTAFPTRVPRLCWGSGRWPSHLCSVSLCSLVLANVWRKQQSQLTAAAPSSGEMGQR